jgi:hypothetical protein
MTKVLTFFSAGLPRTGNFFTLSGASKAMQSFIL